MSAISKIIEIHKTLDKAIDYIIDPDKTNNCDLVSGNRCNPFSAAIEMEVMANYGEELLGSKGKYQHGEKILAYHFVQSFDEKDSKNLTLEEIHKMGEELAEKFTGGKHQYVVATHVDKKHIHNHIIFNARSDTDFRQFRCPPKSGYYKLKNFNDGVLASHGLSQIMPNKKAARPYPRYKSYTEQLREILDQAIIDASSLQDFEKILKAKNITVDFSGQHPTFKIEGKMDRVRRGKSISSAYSSRKQIEKMIKATDKEIGLTLEDRFICRTIGQKLANVKRIEQALKFMHGNDIHTVSDFDKRVCALDRQMQITNDVIADANNELVKLNRAEAYFEHQQENKDEGVALPKIQRGNIEQTKLEISNLKSKTKEISKQINEVKRFRKTVVDILGEDLANNNLENNKPSEKTMPSVAKEQGIIKTWQR